VVQDGHVRRLKLSTDDLDAITEALVVARAQGSAETNDTRTYGTVDSTAHTLSAWAFTGFDAASNARLAAISKAFSVLFWRALLLLQSPKEPQPD
jgi:hypothetical protein